MRLSLDAEVAGVVSEAEDAIRRLNSVAQPALAPLARRDPRHPPAPDGKGADPTDRRTPPHGAELDRRQRSHSVWRGLRPSATGVHRAARRGPVRGDQRRRPSAPGSGSARSRPVRDDPPVRQREWAHGAGIDPRRAPPPRDRGGVRTTQGVATGIVAGMGAWIRDPQGQNGGLHGADLCITPIALLRRRGPFSFLQERALIGDGIRNDCMIGIKSDGSTHAGADQLLVLERMKSARELATLLWTWRSFQTISEPLSCR